jgi:WD domain, G-beta repeat
MQIAHSTHRSMRTMIYRAPGKRLALRYRLLQFTIHLLCCCPLLLLVACASSGGSTQGNQSTTPTPSPAATSTSMPAPTPTPATCTQTGTPPSTLQVAYCGHAGPVIGVAWSPDGKELASSGNDGTAQVWNAQTGLQLWPGLMRSKKDNGKETTPLFSGRIAF